VAGESPGTWLGSGTDRLGPAGEVTGCYASLFRSPRPGSRLTREYCAKGSDPSPIRALIRSRLAHFDLGQGNASGPRHCECLVKVRGSKWPGIGRRGS
jgi:hypothetical protein